MNNGGPSGALDLIEDEDSMVAEQAINMGNDPGLISASLENPGSPDDAVVYANNANELVMGVDNRAERFNGVATGVGLNDFIIDRPILDIEAYAAQFEGVARLQRLLFIADHCPPLRRDAFILCLSSLRNANSRNLRVYEHVCEQLLRSSQNNNEELPTNLGSIPDRNWLETMKRNLETTQAHLEADLKSYRTSSIKESIRRTYEELGSFFVDCGDYDAALRNFSKARENVSTSKSLLSTTLSVIRVAVYKQAWAIVSSYLNKSELQRKPDESFSSKDETWWAQTRCQLECLAGLADLVHGRYKQAAKHFTSAPGQQVLNSNTMSDAVTSAAAVAAAAVDPCSGFADLLSPNCVAIYGAICAMASMDREELRRSVLGNAHFRSLLELEPDFREILRSYYDTKYSVCMQAMERVRDTLRLDIFLSPHVNHLYNEMRRRVLVQYFSPYSAVDITKMAGALGAPINVSTTDATSTLENELAQLVVDGQLSARIDTNAKVLCSRQTNNRAQTYSRVMQLGHEYALAARALLLRNALLKANVSVRSTQGTAAHILADQQIQDSGATGPSPSGALAATNQASSQQKFFKQ